jgi:hypothetical protein
MHQRLRLRRNTFPSSATGPKRIFESSRLKLNYITYISTFLHTYCYSNQRVTGYSCDSDPGASSAISCFSLTVWMIFDRQRPSTLFFIHVCEKSFSFWLHHLRMATTYFSESTGGCRSWMMDLVKVFHENKRWASSSSGYVPC